MVVVYNLELQHGLWNLDSWIGRSLNSNVGKLHYLCWNSDILLFQIRMIKLVRKFCINIKLDYNII